MSVTKKKRVAAGKQDRHREFVARRARKSVAYRDAFERTLESIDLAMFVSEMRESAGFTQAELARRIGTTQSVVARLESAEYRGQSLQMLRKVAGACGVRLELRATKRKPKLHWELIIA